MTSWRNLLGAAGLAALAGLCAAPGAAQAAEITVLGGMGVISGVRDLAAGFQSATGNKVNAVFDANPLAKVNAGNTADERGPSRKRKITFRRRKAEQPRGNSP